MAHALQITFDAQDPARVGAFWELALGYQTDAPPPGFATWDEALAELPEERRNDAYALVDPAGVGPRVFILKVPEGKTAKNRMHLDVGVGRGIDDPDARWETVQAHVAALVAAGGTSVDERRDEWGGHWMVMLDPEGNEFCVQ